MTIDKTIQSILYKEIDRQANNIELIASENFTSDAIMQLCGSVFTNKYAEGQPYKRYYNGCENMDAVETLAIDKLKELFGCDYANVQPHSGANANIAVFKAFLKPGDSTLGLDLSNGGHLSHGSRANLSGAWFDSHFYTVTEQGLIDYDQVRDLALTHRPKMIIGGASAYSRIIDWKLLREIADEIEAVFLADVSHYSGLVAGNAYPSPIPYADVVTSTTHKTLRGPRGGVIMTNNSEFAKMINSAVFPGTQGGPLMHIIAAKAQCFIEALDPSFQSYAQDVIANAIEMAAVFQRLDVPVVSNGTDCHMFTLDLRQEQLSGADYANKLEQYGITVNKNSVPNDPRNFVQTSGIRIGTAAETTRGRNKLWFRHLAEKMVNILKGV
jgi:glycine hydroxymethyltransferase